MGRLPALGLALVAVAASAGDLDQDEALRLRLAGVIQPLEHLLLHVWQRHPGATLLEAELEREGDALVYEVELLTAEGQVREVELDARDGRILKDEEDD
ncbi:PepSY domain-containing protein [Pseudomonas sp. MBLB4123]|uniref:PepSY domain-containing protein n=1 Tax=Pseudomonas sp. MBLB4123 TaxID=3451557 RepID=UPI003F75490E